jgi:hypothetical protein
MEGSIIGREESLYSDENSVEEAMVQKMRADDPLLLGREEDEIDRQPWTYRCKNIQEQLHSRLKRVIAY